METVDVIIPCRGHAAYLKEAVDSVLSQEGDINVHVIIVCDDDEEAFTVASNAAESGPVTALLLDSHVGTYVAINAGLRERRGDWVTFCGADDMFTADRVGMLLDASANDGWRAVANTWHIKVDKDGKHLKLGAETLGGVFMYHAEMVEALGGFKAWPCSADTEFYFRAIRNGGHRCVRSRPAYLYRQHEEQLTRRRGTGFGSKKRKSLEAAMMNPPSVYVRPVEGTIKERITHG